MLDCSKCQVSAGVCQDPLYVIECMRIEVCVYSLTLKTFVDTWKRLDADCCDIQHLDILSCHGWLAAGGDEAWRVELVQTIIFMMDPLGAQLLKIT